MENNKIRENTKRVGASTHPTLAYVMTWFLGAEKVNRGEGSFSTMIRTYSDVQGKLRYGVGIINKINTF